jgi:hypothetical protein
VSPSWLGSPATTLGAVNVMVRSSAVATRAFTASVRTTIITGGIGSPVENAETAQKGFMPTNL